MSGKKPTGIKPWSTGKGASAAPGVGNKGKGAAPKGKPTGASAASSGSSASASGSQSETESRFRIPKRSLTDSQPLTPAQKKSRQYPATMKTAAFAPTSQTRGTGATATVTGRGTEGPVNVETLLRLGSAQSIAGPLTVKITAISPATPDIEGITRRRRKAVFADSTGVISGYIHGEELLDEGVSLKLFKFSLHNNCLKVHQKSWVARCSLITDLGEDVEEATERAMFATTNPRQTVSELYESSDQSGFKTLTGKVTSTEAARLTGQEGARKLKKELEISDGTRNAYLSMWGSAATLEVPEGAWVVVGDCPVSQSPIHPGSLQLSLNFADQLMILPAIEEERRINVIAMKAGVGGSLILICEDGEIYERVVVRNNILITALDLDNFDIGVEGLSAYLPLTADLKLEGSDVKSITVVTPLGDESDDEDLPVMLMEDDDDDDDNDIEPVDQDLAELPQFIEEEPEVIADE